MTKFYRECNLRIRVRKGKFDGYDPLPIYISGLRVSFSMIKTLGWSTNSANIRIWNLSQSNRNLLKDYGDEVTLYAGYREQGQTQVLYIGDTTTITHLYDLPEIVTILECGTGEKFYNQLRVSRSFTPGTAARTIVTEIAKDMGIQIVYFADSDNLFYRSGYSFTGMGKDALEDVCGYLGLEPKPLDNGLYIIPTNSPIVQTPIVINEASGMQGVPIRFTYKGLNLWAPVLNAQNSSNMINRSSSAPQLPFSQPVGYKVNVALDPSILPGAPVILSSSHLGFSSRFKTLSVRHEGDTFGPVWSSQLEMTQLGSFT